jgi:hypothetical protein
MHTKPGRFTWSLVTLAAMALVILSPSCSEDPVEPPPSTTLPVPTSGLLAFYPFSGDALDESGNDHHGSLLGAAAVTTFLTIGLNAADRLSLPYTIGEGLGDFTISAWGRINTINSYHTLISGARASYDNDFFLLFDPSSSEWTFEISGTAVAFGPSATFADLEWHHVVVLRRGSVARLYIDNREIADGLTIGEDATNIDPGGLIVGQEQDSVGGGFQTMQAWSGDLDNLRIYNRALNVTEIRALYEETGWGE